MKFVNRITLVILYIIIGSILVSAPGIARFNGLFVRWVSVQPAPEILVEIIDFDYFKSDTGNIYHLYYGIECTTGCWEKVEEIPAETFYYYLPSEVCDAFSFLPFKQDFVDYKKSCVAWGVGTDMMVQAIDDNGVVYTWDHRLGELSFMSPLLLAIAGGALGLIIGLFRALRFKK